jgi:hypothetical protein
MLSNFEKGFAQFIEGIDSTASKAVKTRRINESICLMASDDITLTKKIVVNEWMLNRAFSSAYAEKHNLK